MIYIHFLSRTKRYCIGILALTFIASTSVYAGSFFDNFIDPEDGQFDASQWLVDRKGFLPVPIFITEPAVGFGLGVGLLFFHGKKEKDNDNIATSESELDVKGSDSLPPSISAVFGLYTENDTWGGGGFHFGSWKEDRWRYLGGLGYASMNLDFYGFGEGILQDFSIPYNIRGLFLLQQLKYRIGKTNLFLGGKYTYLNSEIEFDLGLGGYNIPNLKLESSDGGLGIVGTYDTRDNIFTPNHGWQVDVEGMFHGEAIGGDYTYQKYKTQGITYLDIHKDVVLGLRLDGRFSDGDIPFYALPYIDLRGIPALRYQGDTVVMGEVEARWGFYKRWSLVGFTGVGWAADSLGDLGNATSRHTIGTGLRYFLAKKLGIHGGFDIAHGPEDWVFYIQIGGAWGR